MCGRDFGVSVFCLGCWGERGGEVWHFPYPYGRGEEEKRIARHQPPFMRPSKLHQICTFPLAS